MNFNQCCAPINDSDEVEEISVSIAKIRNGESAGPENILVEALK